MAIAEITMALSALSALNQAVSTIRESANHAADFSSIISKLSQTQNSVHEAELKHAGRMTEKQALDCALAKKRCAAIRQQIKDALILSGNTDVLKDMERILEESAVAHEKMVRQKKAAQRARAKLLREVGFWLSIGLMCFGITMGGLWLYLKLS